MDRLVVRAWASRLPMSLREVLFLFILRRTPALPYHRRWPGNAIAVGVPLHAGHVPDLRGAWLARASSLVPHELAGCLDLGIGLPLIYILQNVPVG
jgi:hypothetical protein